MKRNLKDISILFVLILSLSVFVTGCSSNVDEGPMDDNTSGVKEGMNVEQENDLTGDRNIKKGNVNETDDQFSDNDLNSPGIDNTMNDRSKMISDKLADLDGVNDSTVLITGKTALIGLDIPSDFEKAKTEEIKKTVESKVKSLDKDIDKVIVTADADLTTRIRNVGTDVEGGKPISGFGTEIEEIIKRITPNM